MSTNKREPYSFYGSDKFRCISIGNDFDVLANMIAVTQEDVDEEHGYRVVMCVDLHHLKLIQKEIDRFLTMMGMPASEWKKLLAEVEK